VTFTPETLVYRRRFAFHATLMSLALAAPATTARAADVPAAADAPATTAAPATRPASTRPAAATRPAMAEGYDVKFDRPYKVGDRTKVEAVGAMQTKMVIRSDGDARTVNDTAGLQLDGVSEVTAVDAKGHRTKVSFTVADCKLMAGGKTKPLVPAGKVIEARWEKDQTKYAVDGKDLPDDVGELFDLVLELNDPEGLSDDEIFNTGGGKRRVGDAWAIDPAAAVKEFGRIGLQTKEEDLWGETVLKAVEPADPKAGDAKAGASKAGGSPALTLSMRFKARALAGPGRRPDSKVKFVKGTLTADATVTLPVDPAAQSTREEGKVVNTSELTTTDEAGNALQVSRTAERLYERTLAPAEK
jgi:hypothetical protein